MFFLANTINGDNMKNISIWINSFNINNHISKNLNKDVDILIIGAGITGLTCGYFLKNSNKKIAIIDKNKIGSGITKNTTAKVTYLQQDIYSKLSKNFNKKVSKAYLNSQIDAMNLMRNIIEKENIKCDLDICDSYIFTNSKKNIKKIKEEKEILEEFGIKCSIQEKIPLNNIPCLLSLKVSNTFTINPLLYLEGLRKSINNKIDIYENILAKDIKYKDNKFYVETNNGIFSCNKVIIACWYPFFIKPGFIPIKTYIKREYVNAAKYKNKHFTAINVDKDLLSIRFYKDYIIYGSNEHRLTSKIDYAKNYSKSQKDFKKIFSKVPEYTWMNQDIMSNDYLPLIGKVNNNNNLLIATSYNAWGMTNSTIAGKIISDLILNKDNKYKYLFSPRDINITSIINSFIGIFHYAKAYINTFIDKKIIKNNHVKIIKINGKYHGIYYDKENKRHIIDITCPHMKCHLVFNNYEKTWDCPCHGSRFDIDGNIINGPSKKKIKKSVDILFIFGIINIVF